MGRIIAVANQKGGVGKTTTAVNLAASLAAAERRVLAVDADPQGNLTSGLGRKTRESRPSLYEALIEQRPVEELVIPTDLEHLQLVPSDRNLTGAEVELVSVIAREYRLKEALAPIAGRYDYVIVDCPPSLGLLTLNALTAAQTVLIPLQCEYFALEGISELTATLAARQARAQPRARGRGRPAHDGRRAHEPHPAGDHRGALPLQGQGVRRPRCRAASVSPRPRASASR